MNIFISIFSLIGLIAIGGLIIYAITLLSFKNEKQPKDMTEKEFQEWHDKFIKG